MTVDEDVDFSPLVLDVENILADAIVTCVCCIGPQRGVFGRTPSDRKFGQFPAVNCGAFYGFLPTKGLPASSQDTL